MSTSSTSGEQTSADTSPYMTSTESGDTLEQAKTYVTTHAIKIAVGAMLIVIMYFMYVSFYNNQSDDTFIEKTIKSGRDSDSSFDVGKHVDKLIKLQEDYLANRHPS